MFEGKGVGVNSHSCWVSFCQPTPFFFLTALPSSRIDSSTLVYSRVKEQEHLVISVPDKEWNRSKSLDFQFTITDGNRGSGKWILSFALQFTLMRIRSWVFTVRERRNSWNQVIVLSSSVSFLFPPWLKERPTYLFSRSIKEIVQPEWKKK